MDPLASANMTSEIVLSLGSGIVDGVEIHTHPMVGGCCTRVWICMSKAASAIVRARLSGIGVGCGTVGLVL